MRLTMCGLIFGTRHSQSVVFARAIRIDDPASENRQSLLDVVNLDVIEIEPLATGVCAGELFGQ